MGKFDAAPDRPDFIKPEEQEKALTNPDGTLKPDLRVSEHEDMGVEVRRDMRADGHLARGEATRLSKLEFRSIGQARPKGADQVFIDRDTAGGAVPPTAEPQPAPDLPKPKVGWLGRLFGKQ